jgi:hypothetical protein
MQLKASDRVTIEYSDPEIRALVSEEPDVLAEVVAFRAEIARWAAEQRRERCFSAENASNELRGWSRRYFGGVGERVDVARERSRAPAGIAA